MVTNIQTDDEFTTLLGRNKSKLVVVDFFGENCPPCKAIKPFFNQMPQKYPGVVFCSVECHSCPQTSITYQIRATPTFVFIKSGSVVEKITGADINALISALETHKDHPFSGRSNTIGSVDRAPMKPPTNMGNVKEARAALSDMGFTQFQITNILRENNNCGDVSYLLEWIARHEEKVTEWRNIGEKFKNRKKPEEVTPKGPEKPMEAVPLSGINQDKELPASSKEPKKPEQPSPTTTKPPVEKEKPIVGQKPEKVESKEVSKSTEPQKSENPESTETKKQPEPQKPRGIFLEDIPDGDDDDEIAKKYLEKLQKNKEPVVIDDGPLDLNEAQKSLRENLLEMGYDENLADMVFRYNYGESMDDAINFLEMIQDGKTPEPKRKQKTLEEVKELIRQNREAKKRQEEYNNSITKNLKDQANRRDEIHNMQRAQEQREEFVREMERKNKQKEEQKLMEYNRKRREEKELREAKPVGHVEFSTYRILISFQDKSKQEFEFQLDAKLQDVIDKVVETKGVSNITLETSFPKKVFTSSDYSKSLKELGFKARSSISAKY